MNRGDADRLWRMKIWCLQVEEKISENRRFTITPLSIHFPQISRSLLHKIVSEVKEAVSTFFASQAEPFYFEGVQKLVQRYVKCLENVGNYVEKQCTLCTLNDNIHGLKYILVFYLIAHRTYFLDYPRRIAFTSNTKRISSYNSALRTVTF